MYVPYDVIIFGKIKHIRSPKDIRKGDEEGVRAKLARRWVYEIFGPGITKYKESYRRNEEYQGSGNGT